MFYRFEKEVKDSWIILNNPIAIKIQEVEGKYNVILGRALEGGMCAVIDNPKDVLEEDLYGEVKPYLNGIYIKKAPANLVQKIYEYMRDK